MTTIELIRTEIERLNNKMDDRDPLAPNQKAGYLFALADVLSFLDTLQEPDFPATDEEMEAFLASHPKVEVPEKYKTPDWLYKESEQEPEVDLEKEIERRYDQAKWGYVDGFGSVCMDKGQFIRIARHFAQWGADHTPLPEDTVLFNKGVEEGKRLMMEEAVEGEVMLNPYPTICLDDCKDYDFKDGDKVRIIVCKNED